MRSKIYSIGLALWLAFCVVAPAYDAQTIELAQSCARDE